MANTGMRAFDTYVQKTNKWINDINEELGWQDTEMAYDATRAVLHALRDRLPVNEAIQFAAQLPVLLKGVYFDQYDPGGKPIKMDREAFLQAVQKTARGQTIPTEEAVTGIIKVLSDKTSREMEEVKNALPKEFKSFFPKPAAA